MKMSSGQMGRRLLGLTVAGMTLAAGGAAFGAQPAAVGDHVAGSRFSGDGKHHQLP